MIKDNYQNVPLALREHEHVEVLTPERNTVWVDKGLASLLLALWDDGIETRYSCEGDAAGLGYIYFASFVDLDKFICSLPKSSSEYFRDANYAIIRFTQSGLTEMKHHFC